MSRTITAWNLKRRREMIKGILGCIGLVVLIAVIFCSALPDNPGTVKNQPAATSAPASGSQILAHYDDTAMNSWVTGSQPAEKEPATSAPASQPQKLTDQETLKAADKFEPAENQAIVPESRWLNNLQNLDPVSTDFSKYGLNYERGCAIQPGGVLEIVGSRDLDHLVRYQTNAEVTPGECPSGVMFYISKHEFEEATAEYRKIRTKQLKDERDAERLIYESKFGNPVY